MYLSDHSTALLLQDLEGTHEEFLGVVPADDGKEYGVFRRDKTGAGGMPFFAVYLMAGDYVTWGIFRAEYSGIFHKKLRIDVVSQSFEKREIRCSRPESIRHTQGVERLIGSIMQAGLMGRVFPVEFVPAFRLTHWWLPCRRWLHNL